MKKEGSKRKRNRKKKNKKGETEDGKEKRGRNHMFNEYACRLYARLEIQLRVQTNIHDRYGEEQEISHTRANILRNETAGVKSTSKGIGMLS